MNRRREDADEPPSEASVEKCDDAGVMAVWREVGLPEYFLGNGGTNHKLVDFYQRGIADGRRQALDESAAMSKQRDIRGEA